jgi:hypothetical protein
MAKTEAEKRLSKLTDVGLVQRCEPMAGSLNFLLVRLNRIETDARSADFIKATTKPIYAMDRTWRFAERGAHQSSCRLAPKGGPLHWAQLRTQGSHARRSSRTTRRVRSTEFLAPSFCMM